MLFKKFDDVDLARFGHRYQDMRPGCEAVQLLNVDEDFLSWVFQTQDATDT